ncbi:MAG: nuclear transport factor 2 family protein [Bacteroidota bacterium]
MITDALKQTQENVWNVLLKIDTALVQKDATALEQLLSSDFIGAIPTGEYFTKTAYINHHCRPGVGIMFLAGEDISAGSIRIYDNTAIVNRRVHSQFKIPTGNVLEYDVQRIEVLVKNENGWEMASGQGTQVKPFIQNVQQN